MNMRIRGWLLSFAFVFAGVPLAQADTVTDALKAALNQASDKAVSSLGKEDGFFKNADVHIPLPGKLEKGRKTLKYLGLNKQVDALDLAINRAAEAAVPAARTLFVQSVKQMSVTDALSIVKGPEDAATQYFRKTMTDPLTAAFLPIVSQSTANLDVAQDYNKVAGKAATFGLVKPEDADLDTYVTHKALDGLFLMMAREEANIRKDPLGQANSLIKSVFGSLLKK